MSTSPPLVLATATSTDLFMLGALLVLLCMQIFLAAAETGLNRMSRAKALGLVEANRRGAVKLVKLVSEPEKFINPLLLVILITQTLQTAITTIVADSLFGGLGVVAGLFINVVIVFVVAEAAPKTWAVQHTEHAALMAAGPIHALTRFWPLRMISQGLIGLTNVLLPGKGLKQGPFVSEEEFLAVADEAAQSETIDASERALIKEIIEFGDTVVREVMVPRTDMITVSAEFRVADVMEIVLLNGYSRIPVCGEGIDDIVGLVYAKDLMRAERDGREDSEVSALMRDAPFVPETKRVAELLREMQAQKAHMVIVVDEYGGTAGLATLEDVIEELVGEIVDEFDIEDARIEPLATGGIRVDGKVPLDEANEVLGAELPEGDWDTVGGLLVSALGKIAVEGDEVEVAGYLLRAEKVQGRRVSRIRITPVPPPPDDEATDPKGDERVSAQGQP